MQSALVPPEAVERRCGHQNKALGETYQSQGNLSSGRAGEARSNNQQVNFRSYESSVDLRMGTQVEKLASRSSSNAAERMRLYRKRRRGGLLYVRVPLHVTEIDMLIEKGLLETRHRRDRKAIATAICDLLAELWFASA